MSREGIWDPRVLAAIGSVPRDRFVPDYMKPHAWEDTALPIGLGQTISQPFVVAFMTQALDLNANSRVLEVGTGSGYQTAILATIAGEVWSVEILPELSERAAAVLDELEIDNVHLRVGDGAAGWPETAPFDGIIVTAAAPAVPAALLDQMKAPTEGARGGKLIAPIGTYFQTLTLMERTWSGFTESLLLDVRFVPLVGPDDVPDFP